MAAERLIDAVAAAGAECQVGIADRLSTAVFAARAGRIVEPGGDARFLSLLSIRQLATEPSLSGPGRDDLTDLLWRMGIRTIGQFAALSRTDVASGSVPTRWPRTGSPAANWNGRPAGGSRRRIWPPSWHAIRRSTGSTPRRSPGARWPPSCIGR